MAEQSRGAEPLAPRGHAAVFGAGPTSLAAVAADTFTAADAAGDALVLVADDPDRLPLDALAGRADLHANGRLQLMRTADAYPHRDPVRLLAAFDEVLRRALADGWTGLRVVAENTAMVQGGPDAVSDWLAWEHITSQWQGRNPVVGVCWFDRTALDPDRIAQLASVHPEDHGRGEPTPFRLLAGDGPVQVHGDVDALDVARLVRLLGTVPHDGELVVDVSAAGYLHHTVFPALECAPWEVDRVRLVGATDVLRRVWDSVGRRADRVELV